MSKDNSKASDQKTTKYLHTFFPQSNVRDVSTGSKDSVDREKVDNQKSINIPKTSSLDFSERNVLESGEKMMLKRPKSWRPLGTKNTFEEKLEEVRVKDQVLQEAKNDRTSEEKGWFTDSTHTTVSVKQANDPWYTADIWGDDFPEGAVEECILLASSSASENKVTKANTEQVSWGDWIMREDDNSLLNCLEELSSIEDVAVHGISKQNVHSTAATSSNMDQKSGTNKVGPEGHTDKTYAISHSSNIESHTFPGERNRLTVQSSKVEQQFKTQIQTVRLMSQTESGIHQSKQHHMLSKQDRPLSEEISCSRPSLLSQSQRKLEKPTRSMPTSSSQAHTTDWLRNQLEKVNVEYRLLKENVQTKDGESKLLREKLRTSEQELEKFKMEKVKEMEVLKKNMEGKITELEKKLESTKTKMLFKAKEAESNFGKFTERKLSFAREQPINTTIENTTQKPSLDMSFKKFMSREGRPGEICSQSQNLQVHEATSFDIIRSSPPPTQISLKEKFVPTSSTVELENNHPAAVIETESEPKCHVDIDMFDDIDDDTDLILKLPPSKIKLIQDADEAEVSTSKKLANYRNMAMVKPGGPETEFITAITKDFEQCLITPNKYEENKGELFSLLVLPQIEEEVVPEINFVSLPQVPYNNRKLLFNDMHEHPAENYKKTRPTLKEIWKIPLEAFVPKIERTTHLLHEFVERPLEPDPVYQILSSGRHFTSLADCKPLIFQLIGYDHWDWILFENTILEIVNHVRKMASEIYAALADPRNLTALITANTRDDKVIEECLDYSEMLKKFSILSSKKWKDELHVDLRRGLAIITKICSLDYRLALYLLDPRLLKSSKTQFLLREIYINKGNTSTNRIHKQGHINMPEVHLTKEAPSTILAEGKYQAGNNVELLLKKLDNQQTSTEGANIEVKEYIESKLNKHCPEPEETVCGYKIRMLAELKNSGELSQIHVAALNTRLEELINEGKLKSSKPEKCPHGLENQSNVAVIESKSESSKLVTRKKDSKQDKDFVNVTSETTNGKANGFEHFRPDWSHFNELWVGKEGQRDNTKVNDRIFREKVIKEDYKKRDKIEPITNASTSISTALAEMKIPKWMTAIKESTTIMDNNMTCEEWLFAREDNCYSQLEKDFVNDIASNMKRIKKALEGTLKDARAEDSTVSQYPSTSTKRKFDETDSNRGNNVPSSVRTSPPPPKKREISDIDEKAGPSTELPVDVNIRRKTKFVPTAWRKSVYKKADVAPLKSTTGSELSVRSQDALNEEVEMEIEKLFIQPTKVDVEKKREDPEQDDTVRPSTSTNPPAENLLNESELILKDTEELSKNDMESSGSEVDGEEVLSTTEECLSALKKKLKTAGLLELLFEIIKSAGELKYSWKFNALMATLAHLLEVICGQLWMMCIPSRSIAKLGSILRELLYARPSPVVVYFINRCLTKAVRLKGFAKTLCHNSDPRTFVKNEDVIYYVRGSCTLQTLCLLMDLTINDSCWKGPIELIKWVNYVFTNDKEIAASWYPEKEGVRVKRCFCLRALSNLFIRIIHRAIVLYRSRMSFELREKTLPPFLKRNLEMIFQDGLETLYEMIMIDMKCFVRNIRTSYQRYIKFLELLESIHLDNNIFQSFKLSMSKFCKLQVLLSSKRLGEKILEEADIENYKLEALEDDCETVPEFSNLYQHSRPWPSDQLESHVLELEAVSERDVLNEW